MFTCTLTTSSSFTLVYSTGGTLACTLEGCGLSKAE